MKRAVYDKIRRVVKGKQTDYHIKRVRCKGVRPRPLISDIFYIYALFTTLLALFGRTTWTWR